MPVADVYLEFVEATRCIELCSGFSRESVHRAFESCVIVRVIKQSVY